jgi:hypothetical protein
VYLINMEFEARFAFNFSAMHGRSPGPRERRGARRIGDQLVKFWVQFQVGKDVQRCRQIIFANIPMICVRHGLDFEFVKTCIEQVIEGRGFAACVFLELVYDYHRKSPDAPVPSPVVGCVLPLAVALLSASLLFGIAVSA